MTSRRFLEPGAGGRWPLDGFASDEQPYPSAMFPRYVESGFERVSDVFDPSWPARFPTARRLDRVTVGEFMAAQGASDTWRRWFAGREGNILRMNALAAFTVESLSGHEAVFAIRGGNDTMAGRVWDLSALQPNRTKGMLNAYMFDVEALQFTALDPHQRVEAMTGLMSRILPGLPEQTEVVQEKAWHEDPWAGGGWCWAPPGDLTWMYQAMRRPEGRVHFAGEHTSVWITWMNGALESAHRVTNEILHVTGAGLGQPTGANRR